MNQTANNGKALDIELVSFKLCPYVQRSVITLLEKNIDFKTTYIDLNEPPQWFLDLSPFGKVPLLRIADTALFESAVINEYLDEITPPSLHPSDPLLKAQNRSWIEFASDLSGNFYRFMMAKDEATGTQLIEELRRKFKQLEQQLQYAPYFNGQIFSLIDCAFAPLFKHISTIDKNYPLALFSDYPKIDAWRSALESRPAVQSSVVDDYEALFSDYIRNSDSHIAQFFN